MIDIKKKQGDSGKKERDRGPNRKRKLKRRWLNQRDQETQKSAKPQSRDSACNYNPVEKKPAKPRAKKKRLKRSPLFLKNQNRRQSRTKTGA